MLLPVYGYWYVVTGMYLGPHLSLFFSLFLFYFFAVYGRYYRILQSLTSHQYVNTFLSVRTFRI